MTTACFAEHTVGYVAVALRGYLRHCRGPNRRRRHCARAVGEARRAGNGFEKQHRNTQEYQTAMAAWADSWGRDGLEHAHSVDDCADVRQSH